MPAGLAVIAVTYGLARYGFGLFLPQFRGEFGVTAATAGGIAAGSYLAYCLTALLAQRQVGRQRARTALWLAGGTAAVGSAVVASAPSAGVLAAGVLVAGSGAGAATPALVAAVTATVRPAVEQRAQAVVNSGTGAGVVAGGLLVLAAPGLWRWAWAGFAVLALAATWAADRRTAWAQVGRHEDGDDDRSGLPLGPLARPLVAAVLGGAGCAAVWTFGRDLLARDGGLPDSTTGLLWCVLGAGGLAGGLSGDLVGRAGLRRAWAGAAALATAAVLLLAALPGAAVPAGLALAAFGCAFVVLSGVLLAWGAHRVPAAAPQAAAVLFVGLTVGQAAGALVLGVVADRAGAPAAFVVAAVLLVGAALAAEPRTRVSAAATPGSRRR
ncbi:putative MFS family arabinose efflux permease [Modestobacter versicolor]|uniref:Putative MFS family arabinose efflux permease n=2 Tax=Modestobacter versicolor TaxID=429133 RepID=A0A839XV44_9ACTN|nr:putative MFS family arabinose efflux permease [Modestobacter versicolor]